MSWTKREFVVQAFEEIGYASYVYDATTEQLTSVLRRLDGMMATWNAKGIRVGYPLPNAPTQSNLNDLTHVQDAANEAIYTNLAVRIAPIFGKEVSLTTKQIAKESYNALLTKAVMPTEMQLNNSLPAGAGNKRIDAPFLNKPTAPLSVGNDGELEFN